MIAFFHWISTASQNLVVDLVFLATVDHGELARIYLVSIAVFLAIYEAIRCEEVEDA